MLHLEFALLQQRVTQELVELVTISHGLQTTGTTVDRTVGHVNLQRQSSGEARRREKCGAESSDAAGRRDTQARWRTS